MQPFEQAWALLKAPIDYYGYSDIPDEEMANQEQADFRDYIKEHEPLSHPDHPSHPHSLRDRRSVDQYNLHSDHDWRIANPFRYMKLVDEFNRQRGNE
jgi:hypothetical protein